MPSVSVCWGDWSIKTNLHLGGQQACKRIPFAVKVTVFSESYYQLESGEDRPGLGAIAFLILPYSPRDKGEQPN